MDFNPRSREGSDARSWKRNGKHWKFQSTLPRGERPRLEDEHQEQMAFQSTLPRGERPGGLNPGDMFEISIHAPARGATHLPKTLFRFGAFQSTLPRGERHGQRRWAAACKNFNPRSREGSDTPESTGVLHVTISIHAPARGATKFAVTGRASEGFQSTLPRGERLCPMYGCLYIQHFNPRSREGSDTLSLHVIRHCTHFNPRSREGSDYVELVDIDIKTDFNPRSREGSDDFVSQREQFTGISIHAPARGATLAAVLVYKAGEISIHAPARGATRP